MTKLCAYCAKEFTPKKGKEHVQKFCCDKCRDAMKGRGIGRNHREQQVNIAHSKVFDLEVGEMIFAPDNYTESRALHKFKVTRIFPHIIECERVDTGMIRYYTKSAQIMGEVKRV